MKKYQINKLKKLFFLCIAFSSLMFTSCSKLFDKDTPEDNKEKYDGEYKGKAFQSSGSEIGEWSFLIEDSKVFGDFTSSGTNDPQYLSGNVNSSGLLNLDIATMGVMANATIDASSYAVSGTWKDDEGETGTLSGNKINHGGGGSGNGCNHELVGKWVTTSGNVDITFNCTSSTKEGVLHYKDVNGTPGCKDGSVTNFAWSTNGNTLSLNYISMFICGEKRNTPANDAPKSYTITGNTLKWAGATWTKQ